MLRGHKLNEEPIFEVHVKLSGGLDDLPEKTKPHRRKDMIITMKSKPLKSGQTDMAHIDSDNNARPKDYKKKGTRGSAWIG
jgi:hypothetical protein